MNDLESFAQRVWVFKHGGLLAVVGLAVIILSACSTFTNPGAPDQSFDVDKDIQALEKVFGTSNSIEVFYKGTPTEVARDKFIVGRLVLINIHYIEFIKKFSVSKAQLDSALDIATIGVDLATTLAGGAAIKAILGAVSGGLTSSRISIDKNFFQQKTVPVLITAMNAQRKEALIPILTGMKKSLKDYRLAEAVSDLHAYYNAGTFIGALQAIQKDSGEKEANADEEIKDIKASFSEDRNTVILTKYVGWDGSEYKNAANLSKLKAWMNINDIPGSVSLFLSNADHGAERRKAVKDLKLK